MWTEIPVILLFFSSLAKDQTEINRIIAEASKGSKFYEARCRLIKQFQESDEISGLWWLLYSEREEERQGPDSANFTNIEAA